jgi:hypothetical protein
MAGKYDCVKISGICDYIIKVSQISSGVKEYNKANGTYLKLFFRGQTNHSYGVAPSVFREDRVVNEAAAVKELTLLAPKEFDVHVPIFERLTKMQHYGLPTRLLDITTNPLVALFFACWEPERNKNIDKDGEVIVIIDKPVTPEDRVVNYFSKLAEYDEKTGQIYDFIAFLVESGVMKDAESRDTKKIECLTKRFLTVIPSMNNERIRSQQSAFLLFGTEWDGKATEFRKKSFDIKKELLCNKKDGIPRSIVIDAAKKKELLDDLDVLGINEAKLFPELEHQASYVSDRIHSAKTVY